MKWPRAGLPAGKERSLARLTSANRQSTSPGIPHDQGADGGCRGGAGARGQPLESSLRSVYESLVFPTSPSAWCHLVPIKICPCNFRPILESLTV